MRTLPVKHDREAFRSTGVVVLLLASVLLVLILAWQAVDAARSHRAATAAVLRDFAALAGGEFIRRVPASVGYDAYFPLITALRQTTPAQAGVLMDRDRLSAAVDASLTLRERRVPGVDGKYLARNLVLRLIRFEPETGRLDSDVPLPVPLAEKLKQALTTASAAGSEGGRAYQMIHLVVEGEAHSFVMAPLGAGKDAPPVLVGFEPALDKLGAWFRRIFDRAPLLPPSLGRGKVGNEHISLSLLDAAGREMFRTGDFSTSGFTAEVPFGDAYDGTFEGMKVRVSLDEAAAPNLVIGGLPSSRLPLLLCVLFLTIGFVVAGIRQLRRERALAALRTDFVSRVSHELRTPLTQIRLFTETLLLDRVRSEEERRRSLQIIDREARRLGHLVENILQFSRGERGGVRLEPRLHDLQALIQDALESFQPLARRTHAVLESDIPGSLTAYVDEGAVRQILLNLLDNAAKYGPDGQHIRVGALSQNGHCRLWVEDQGPGIPAHERERVWESFRRLRQVEGAAVAGTGIGLSVVRELVILQGGACWVEDAAQGGARFVVEFLARPPASPGAQGDAR